ncbi:hypothetical protein B0T10DRAFT_462662 [Thelonectria olida]|uniref:Uncharacterized protein n=1 Tax=Thelonectria olida TaxID=1576542 RepID=A0A9P8VYA4_9HYPO|nr:hypothetical protein B0T10DRAFT_462662 [Thelonectria olida]
MSTFSSHSQGQRLNGGNQLNYQGTAKVSINALVFAPDDTPCDVNVDFDKVERLKRIFKLEGCDRLNPRNYIPGEISREVLQAAMIKSNVTEADLNADEPRILYLPPCASIRCPHGRSRVKALEDSNDYGRLARWWTIELYTDMVPEAFDILSEEFLNEKSFSDGHILVKICLSRRKNLTAENRWLARLSKSKAEILKRVLKHPLIAPVLTKIMLEIPGMRNGLEIGVWHKIIGAKNPEVFSQECYHTHQTNFFFGKEVVHYMEYIYSTLVSIMGSKEALQFVDTTAIQTFELRCPGLSQLDCRHIKQAIINGEVFKTLTDDVKRKQILERAQQVKYLIPSIHTLQKDFKYLRPCTDVLRQLVLGKSQIPFSTQTIAFDALRRGNNSSIDSETIFFSQMKLLYLHIMQNIVELSGENPLMEDDEVAPAKRIYDQRAWSRLASKASRLGFRSDEISRLVSLDPDRLVALRALNDARPPSEYEYGNTKLEEFISSITQIFQQAQRRESVGPRLPVFTTSGVGEPLPRRCGRHYSRAYSEDRSFLTEDVFRRQIEKGNDITSLFVRKSVFNAFWGVDDWEPVDNSGSGSGQVSPSESENSMQFSDDYFAGMVSDQDQDMEQPEVQQLQQQEEGQQQQQLEKLRQQLQQQQQEIQNQQQAIWNRQQDLQRQEEDLEKQKRRQEFQKKNQERHKSILTKRKGAKVNQQRALPTSSRQHQSASEDNAVVQFHDLIDPNSQLISSPDGLSQGGETSIHISNSCGDRVERCRRHRQSIEDILAAARNEHMGDSVLMLYNIERRGIGLDDCTAFSDIFLCPEGTDESFFEDEL